MPITRVVFDQDAVLAHGTIKEREVSSKEIDRTIERKRLFEQKPDEYTYREEEQMAEGKIKSDALKILPRRYYKNNPERLTGLEEAFINDDVARKIHELRTEAGLSMRELADLVGLKASVICQLEDAEYEGHSLSMLNRIASALNMRVKVDFIPLVSEARSI